MQGVGLEAAGTKDCCLCVKFNEFSRIQINAQGAAYTFAAFEQIRHGNIIVDGDTFHFFYTVHQGTAHTAPGHIPARGLIKLKPFTQLLAPLLDLVNNVRILFHELLHHFLVTNVETIVHNGFK